MIVYGDPQFTAPANLLAARLRSTFARIRSASVDDLRAFLIQAGQLEQAVSDHFNSSSRSGQSSIDLARRVTDDAARAFCAGFLGSGSPDLSESHSSLAALEKRFAREHTVLTVKVPEGFEFYALYPEQYCNAAIDWARSRPSGPREALVLGIRSIGTTLSAVVAATLERLGWRVVRQTARPTGHPFEREVNLCETFSTPAAAVVIDEGPGLSGSSMAAAADALNDRGIRDVSFLPGHAGMPGNACSESVRHRWMQTPRYVSRLESVRWDGSDLGESLRRKTVEWTGRFEGFETLRDLSGGEWRWLAFASEADWPAALTSFERTKILCSDANGDAVLWKFTGMGGLCEPDRTACDAAFARMTLLANEGFAPRPLGCFRGFIGMKWVNGRRLTRRDGRDPAVLRRIGRYIARAAGAEVPRPRARANLSRLAEMLYWNAREIPGAGVAQQTKRFHAAAEAMAESLSYGDGHLAPHEWIEPPESPNHFLKSDCCGHARDHTMIGEQSVLWDVAGTMIEWDLEPETAAPLLVEIEAAGIELHPAALCFYELAYAAFQCGIRSIAIAQTTDFAEQKRLQAGLERYRDKLCRTLEAPTDPVRSNF